MRLFRAHGLGNDYLVLEDSQGLSPDLVRAICDRHRGVGGDGILEPKPAKDGAYGVCIWNPDGSIAEKSGNGLRIFAWWLVNRRGAPAEFDVWTGHDTVQCEVSGQDISVAMGRAVVEMPRRLDGLDREFRQVDLGNPHAVVFVEDDLDALPWRQWGEWLEQHPHFQNRTNVQIARVVDISTVEIRIWERGAGETLASGSSSCAVASAGVASGRLRPGPITVRMPGGILHVNVDAAMSVLLRGPVEPIGVCEVWPSWLSARG